jgi:hypothetical protein
VIVVRSPVVFGVLVLVRRLRRVQGFVAVHVFVCLPAVRMRVFMRVRVLVHMRVRMRMAVMEIAVPVPVLVRMRVLVHVLVQVTVGMVRALGGFVVRHATSLKAVLPAR